MPSSNNRVVNTNVVFVSDQSLIRDAVQIMVERKISSILVTDEADTVVGIVTERDIVQKFTLLDVGDKLTRIVNTIMNRPVVFVAMQTLDQDIARLHIERKIRHFPILQGTEPKKQNVVGIISVTDILRPYLMNHYKPAGSSVAPTPATPGVAQARRHLHVLAKNPAIAEPYVTIFTQIGLTTTYIEDFAAFVATPGSSQAAILFDMDAYMPKELQRLVVMTRKFRGDLIMATSNLALVAGLRRFLDARHQDILVKPIDYSFCHWLLTNKWTHGEASA